MPSERFGECDTKFFRPLALTLLLVSAVYLLLRSKYPISLLMLAVNDDALFLSLGRSLVSGYWLGDFDSNTLIKGPGYPLFLALVHWSQLSYPLVLATLHLSASLLVGWAVTLLTRQRLLGLLVYLLVLWHPASWALSRIIRDGFYSDILLITLALTLVAIFRKLDRLPFVFFTVIAGVCLGWVWLTREESIWLLPGFILLFAGAIFVSGKSGRPLKAGVIVTGLALMVVTGAQFGNWRNYGSWSTVDSGAPNFSGALDSLQSVTIGLDVSYLAPSARAREEIYSASPAMEELRFMLEPAGTGRWQSGCQFYPQTCGDIAAGWFNWALRGSADAAGYYSSAASAEVFFGRVKQELEMACDLQQLDCSRKSIPGIPPMTTEQWHAVPGIFSEALKLFARGAYPDYSIVASTGAPQELQAARAYLNEPPLRLSAAKEDQVLIRGWYLDANQPRSWITADLRTPDDVGIAVEVVRLGSPDLMAHYEEPRAVKQRFQLRGSCNEHCRLSIRSESSGDYDFLLGELLDKQRHQIIRGRAALVIEGAQKVKAHNGPAGWVKASQATLDFLNWLYPLLMYPLSAIGFLALMFGLILAVIKRRITVALVVAASLWALVAARLTILVLIHASSFPGLTLNYMLPGWVLIALAAPISIYATYDLYTNELREEHS